MEDILYTVPEVAKLLKTSQGLVYKLINAKKLPALKLGALKVRRTTILKFLEDYEGYDVSDPSNVTELDGDSISDLAEEIKKVSNAELKSALNTVKMLSANLVSDKKNEDKCPSFTPEDSTGRKHIGPSMKCPY